jgi:hypothetical protein
MSYFPVARVAVTRETRKGWPLLTVETEVSGNSKRTNLRGVLPWLLRWTRRAGTIYS